MENHKTQWRAERAVQTRTELAAYEWQLFCACGFPDKDLFTPEQIDMGISFFGAEEVDASRYTSVASDADKASVVQVSPAFVEYLSTLLLPIQSWFGGKPLKDFLRLALTEYWMASRGIRSQYESETRIKRELEKCKAECRKQLDSHFVNHL